MTRIMKRNSVLKKINSNHVVLTTNFHKNDSYDLNYHNRCLRYFAIHGLWKIPVPRVYGGYGRGWTECISLVKSLAVSSRSFNAVKSIISHLAKIFIVVTSGEILDKSHHLTPLLVGKADEAKFNHFLRGISKTLTINYINFQRIMLSIASSYAATKMCSQINENFGCLKDSSQVISGSMKSNLDEVTLLFNKFTKYSTVK